MDTGALAGVKKEPHDRLEIDESRLSQRPHGLGLGAAATRASVVGVSAGLHSGAEPGLVLVAHWKRHELANFRPDSYGAQQPFSPSTTTDEAPVDAGMRVFAAGRAVSIVYMRYSIRSWLSWSRPWQNVIGETANETVKTGNEVMKTACLKAEAQHKYSGTGLDN